MFIYGARDYIWGDWARRRAACAMLPHFTDEVKVITFGCIRDRWSGRRMLGHWMKVRRAGGAGGRRVGGAQYDRYCHTTPCKSPCPHRFSSSSSSSLAPSGFSSYVQTNDSHRVQGADQSSDNTARSRAQVHGSSSATWGALMVSPHPYTIMASLLKLDALCMMDNRPSI